MKPFKVTSYIRIRNGKVFLNGERELKSGEDPADHGKVLRDLYKMAGLGYRKFYKMDDLCKLGFLSAEILLNENPVSKDLAPENIGIVLANRASSLDTDRDHYRTIADPEQYHPSPAIFVYTLPNIVIGEICIRHKIRGENAFYIFERFEAEPIVEEFQQFWNEDRVNFGIGGWVELDEDVHDAFLFTLEPGNSERKDLLGPDISDQLNTLFYQT